MVQINFIIQAIQQLDPTARWDIFGPDDIRIVDSDITMERVTALAEELQATYASNKYKHDRIKAYPPIGDQLDAIWKGGLEAEAMLAVVNAVKAKYPKPTQE